MWTREQHELSLLPAHTRPLAFRVVDEPQPGESWCAAFAAMWPAYRAWWLKEGEWARPDLTTCTAMLEKWMPELGPTFERLVELAGGDPLAARFLSMYRPPGFVVGCSQAAFTGDGGPALVRNYDYPASRVEGIVYRTSWTGRRVIGMSDCLWGLLDGVNDAGLAASLTFGGRPAVGDGFGIPLVIRYVLEVCEDVESACAVLAQVPVHAVQNVTLIDRGGDFATVRVGPDREPEVLTVPVATNHQHRGDWPDYERGGGHVRARTAAARAAQDPRDEPRPARAGVPRAAAVPGRVRERARDALHGRLLPGDGPRRIPLARRRDDDPSFR